MSLPIYLNRRSIAAKLLLDDYIWWDARDHAADLVVGARGSSSA